MQLNAEIAQCVIFAFGLLAVVARLEAAQQKAAETAGKAENHG